MSALPGSPSSQLERRESITSSSHGLSEPGTMDPHMDSPRDSISDLIEIETITERRVRRFRTTGTEYRVKVAMPEQLPQTSPAIPSTTASTGTAITTVIDFVREVFSYITDKVFEDIPDHDMTAIQLSWDYLEHPAWVPFGLKKDFEVERFLDRLENIFQSNESVSLDKPFTVSVTRVEMPCGEGPRLRGLTNRLLPELNEWLTKKRAVIRIKNLDNLCLGRALVVGRAQSQQKSGTLSLPRFKTICKERKLGLQTQLTWRLYEKAGIGRNEANGSLEEVAAFQAVMPNYRIIVRDVASMGEVIYSGQPENEDIDEEINLILHNNHYDVITRIPAFLGKQFYCKECSKFDSGKKGKPHKCKRLCRSCQKQTCPETNSNNADIDWRLCDDCRRWFKSGECFAKHKKVYGRERVKQDPKTGETIVVPPRSTCDRLKICPTCHNLQRADHVHVCHSAWCRTCARYRPREHLCFIPVVNPDQQQPLITPKKVATGMAADLIDAQHEAAYSAQDNGSDLDSIIDDSDDDTKQLGIDFHRSSSTKQQQEQVQSSEEVDYRCETLDDVYTFIFYDFETTQNTTIDDGRKLHLVNLAIAHHVCHDCSASFRQPEQSCKKCSQHTFDGTTALQDFTSWLLLQSGATVVAHNASGFDGILLAKELVSRGIPLHNAIYRGQKLMYGALRVGLFNIRLIDSLNFVMAPLSAFPKLFELTNAKKGFFPHLFNKDKNKNYCGSIPAIKYYDPDSMSADQRRDFLAWYDTQSRIAFDMAHEIRAYCQSDVDILKRGMLRFREIFRGLAGLDILRECITIASGAMRCFRKNYLVADSVGVIPRKGYTNYQRQSRKAFGWLKWYAVQNGKKVEHNGNGQERTVCGRYYVDGYVAETNTVLEFLGCYYHSCPKCFDLCNQNPTTKVQRKVEYERTIARLQAIRDAGYNLIYVWECAFDQRMRENGEFMVQVNALKLTTPLQPVHALFGGRTNALKLHHDAKQDEEIKVLDFTSLYPYVNARCAYPLGHPQIITEGFDEDLSNYFGLIKCRILPPTDLFLPVLPYRSSDGKLTFPLCSECAETQERGQCNHNVQERSWIGTFTTVELAKALAKRYRAMSVYEVWHWERVAKFDKETRTGGLFNDYIKTFLKVKQESSGWPDDCTDEEAKVQYLQTYKDHEGIQLDRNKICKSPLRSVAKLLLNSLWGKFAQNPNMGKTEYISNYRELVKRLTDNNVIVSSLRIVHDNLVNISYKTKDSPPLSSENVAIAAFTTAHARLKLYDVMDRLVASGHDKLLYTDTDSVFYVKPYGESSIPCGKFLGDLVDEYPNRRITSFCSAGPKSYCYKFADGGSVIKVKGISLNFRNSAIITPDVMLQLVLKEYPGANASDSGATSEESVTVINQRKITRDRVHGIVSRCEKKIFRVVYTKRVLHHNGITFPYGYRTHGRKRRHQMEYDSNDDDDDDDDDDNVHGVDRS